MNKVDFKNTMSSYRRNLAASLHNRDAYIKARNSNLFAESCLKPVCLPVVSRAVMLHKLDKGGLCAIKHIDSVAIKYR